MAQTHQKRSLALAGHRTSLALEPDFWAVLEEEARGRGVALAALIAEIDRARADTQSLASACRLAALGFSRRR